MSAGTEDRLPPPPIPPPPPELSELPPKVIQIYCKADFTKIDQSNIYFFDQWRLVLCEYRWWFLIG